MQISTKSGFKKDLQYWKFCTYGFLKNLRLFEPFLFLFFLDAGLTYLKISLLYTIREIVRYLMEIPAGFIADILGRRRTMIASFVFYLVSFLLFFISSDFYMFVFAICFYAFGDAFRTGTHKAMIYEYLTIMGWSDHKVSYYGHTRSWSQIGSAISSLLAGAIVFISGNFRLIFLISAIPYLLDLLLMISYPKAIDGELVDFDRSKLGSIFKKVFKEFVFSLKQVKVLKAITNVSIYSGYFRAVKDFIQPIIQVYAVSIPLFIYLDDEKRTAIIIGLVYFIIYFISSFASRNSGRLAGRFKNLMSVLNFSLIAGFVIGLVSGLFYNSGFLLISIVLFVLIFVVENLRKPIGVAYITDILNKNILATALSVESQAKTVITALLLPLLGFIADRFGIGYALIIVPVLLLLMLPFYLARK